MIVGQLFGSCFCDNDNTQLKNCRAIVWRLVGSWLAIVFVGAKMGKPDSNLVKRRRASFYLGS